MKKTLALLALLAVMAQGCASVNSSRQPDGQVELTFFKPFASSVVLCTSTAGFEPLPPVSRKLGNWQFSVPGHETFSYFFLVDGEAYVPDCVYREQDDFGRYNCIFPVDM